MPKPRKAPREPDAEDQQQLRHLKALRRQAKATYFPAPLNPIRDTSIDTLPRLVGADAVWRSRLLDELATLQMLLMRAALRPLETMHPASLPQIAKEIRGLIKDQLAIVEGAPVGLSADSAKHQVRDLLERHALVTAELRRRGLGRILDAMTGAGPSSAVPEGMRELLAGARRGDHPPADLVSGGDPERLSSASAGAPAPEDAGAAGAGVGARSAGAGGGMGTAGGGLEDGLLTPPGTGPSLPPPSTTVPAVTGRMVRLHPVDLEFSENVTRPDCPPELGVGGHGGEEPLVPPEGPRGGGIGGD